MAADCTLPDVCRLVHGGVKDPFFYVDSYPRPALINMNFLASNSHYFYNFSHVYEKFDLVHFLV